MILAVLPPAHGRSPTVSDRLRSLLDCGTRPRCLDTANCNTPIPIPAAYNTNINVIMTNVLKRSRTKLQTLPRSPRLRSFGRQYWGVQCKAKPPGSAENYYLFKLPYLFGHDWPLGGPGARAKTCAVNSGHRHREYHLNLSSAGSGPGPPSPGPGPGARFKRQAQKEGRTHPIP